MISKIHHFLWRFVRGFLPCFDALSNRLGLGSRCVLCQGGIDSVADDFRDCCWVQEF